MTPDTLFAWAIAILAAGGGLCLVLGARQSVVSSERSQLLTTHCSLLTGRLAGLVAFICSLAALVLGARLLIGELLFAGPYAEEGLYVYHKFPGDVLRVDLLFGFSLFSAVLNLMVLGFGFLVVLYSLTYVQGRNGSSIGEQGSAGLPAAAGLPARFFAYCLWAVAGASVALTTGHLLVFVFAWEIVTLMLYLLVGLGGPRARKGAAKSFAMLGFSDAMIILAIAALIRYRGTAALYMSNLEGPLHIVISTWKETGIYLLLLVGALAKAGAFPMHTWIPAAAEHAPMPAMALLPASLDKLLGIVLLARISLSFFTLSAGLKILLMVIGAVTILGAVMMAMVQHNLRRLLSFHAVSQVGYMVLGIGTGVPIGIIGGLFHMVNHSIYKCLLFLSGGAVESQTGDLELDRLGGLSRAMPVTFASFLIGSLAISGVPPLNGFVSKWLVYQGVLQGGGSLMPLLLAAAVLGSALTLASFVKALHSVFLGERSPELAARSAPVREAPTNMLFPMSVLAGLCIALGLGATQVVQGFFAPWVGQMMGGQAAGLAEFAGTPGLSFKTGLWVPLAGAGPGAVLLVLLGLLGGVLFYLVGNAFKVRRVRTFSGGEIETPASTQVLGTGFYLTVRELPIIRGFYKDAEQEAFDVYRLTGQYGQGVVTWLRRLHSGVLETYVTWILIGAAVVAAAVFLAG